eukprot:TRINITY_DN121389_c0_g1_i1.p1 TRINITY_DN121389_c0_g1~~TRINITY_DN121389_c0_g1_i1.p1  ORF type:complete len:311 (-),score=88.30 TRINITY_DN121389_c0_g1_i1:147-1004(-)
MPPAQRLAVVSSHIVPAAVSGQEDVVKVSETPNVRHERKGRVAILTLVRTSALNALCDPLIKDLSAALQQAEADAGTGCVVITGAGKAFAAGADIKEMAPLSFADITINDKFKSWACVAECKLPVIAAVNGFCFGGGCELAMMCDIMVASNKAVFGQPEIKLGVIPGAGGTQRLVRSIGKSKAMQLILTGRNFSAEEAEKAGLVSEVVAPDALMPTCLKMAEEIAGFGRLATQLAKEAVNSAYETTLQEGLHAEKKMFYSLFATEDKKEGMEAFIEKRKAVFKHK